MKDDFTLKNGRDNLYLVNDSDWHLGSNYCNLPYIEHHIGELEKLKGYMIINILGDIFECADARVGNSAYKQVLSLNEQLRLGRKIFRRLLRRPKTYLRWCVPGNHCARWKRNDFDVMEEFAETLGANYNANTDMPIKYKKDESLFVASGNFVDKIWVNGKPLKIFGRHGNGSAKRLDLAMGKQGRETIYKDADILVEGHNHRCHYYSQTVETSKDEGTMKRRHYGFTGHMLSYPESYAADMGLDVLPEAYLRFNINDVDDKLHINGQEFFIDRYRPDLFTI